MLLFIISLSIPLAIIQCITNLQDDVLNEGKFLPDAKAALNHVKDASPSYYLSKKGQIASYFEEVFETVNAPKYETLGDFLYGRMPEALINRKTIIVRGMPCKDNTMYYCQRNTSRNNKKQQ